MVARDGAGERGKSTRFRDFESDSGGKVVCRDGWVKWRGNQNGTEEAGERLARVHKTCNKVPIMERLWLPRSHD